MLTMLFVLSFSPVEDSADGKKDFIILGLWDLPWDSQNKSN
jgi:hypothetical protein